jgi:hypothetical protein
VRVGANLDSFTFKEILVKKLDHMTDDRYPGELRRQKGIVMA